MSHLPDVINTCTSGMSHHVSPAGQTGQLWTSADLATVGETTTTTAGTSIYESGAEQTDQQQQSKATHLQSVLTQQRPNWREGTPLGTPPDSREQAVKEHMSSS